MGDTRDGRIYTAEQVAAMSEEDRQYMQFRTLAEAVLNGVGIDPHASAWPLRAAGPAGEGGEA